jgi:phosphatidylserine/phosphatidylglycerophosphate/cardiolipin synthase-like enzyme
MSRLFSLLLSLCLLLFACNPTTPTPEINPTPSGDITPIELEAGYGVKGAWFELYFTNPESPLSPQATGGVDGPLVKAIDSAKLSIDVAAYSISLNSVRYALINAHDRGVTVRIVMESENMDRSDPQALIEAGIPIVGDEQPGLMHDKFMIIDKSEVWLGSMNFTDSGTYEDNNNLIRIRSTKLAENYTIEFEEMYDEELFGENVRAATPHPELAIASVEIQNYFSPDDGVLSVIAPLLRSAEESIYFLAFSFTSNELGGIVRDKAQAGLTVQGVMEEEQVKSNQGTEYDPFQQAGLDVRIDGIDGQMHHKVFIIDRKIVILGSYNFSQAAETRNDENILIIDNEAIAQEFIKEFNRIWKLTQP